MTDGGRTARCRATRPVASMTDPERGNTALLTEIRRQQDALAAAPGPGPNPGGYYTERLRWAHAFHRHQDEREHGPQVAALYGDGYDDAARKRVRRALDRLQAAGLVELWGPGRNVTHVRLTAEGGRVAWELATRPAV